MKKILLAIITVSCPVYAGNDSGIGGRPLASEIEAIGSIDISKIRPGLGGGFELPLGSDTYRRLNIRAATNGAAELTLSNQRKLTFERLSNQLLDLENQVLALPDTTSSNP